MYKIGFSPSFAHNYFLLLLLMHTLEIMLLMYSLHIIRFIRLKYTIQCFFMNLHSGADIPTIHFRTFQSPNITAYAHLQLLSVPIPSPWQPLISFVSQTFCLLWTFCINGTTQSVPFRDALRALSSMLLRFTRGVICKCTPSSKDAHRM